MKKIVAIALVVVSLCAVGCGGDTKPKTTGGAAPATGSAGAK